MSNECIYLYLCCLNTQPLINCAHGYGYSAQTVSRMRCGQGYATTAVSGAWSQLRIVGTRIIIQYSNINSLPMLFISCTLCLKKRTNFETV